jgi:hypothetical protein
MLAMFANECSGLSPIIPHSLSALSDLSVALSLSLSAVSAFSAPAISRSRSRSVSLPDLSEAKKAERLAALETARLERRAEQEALQRAAEQRRAEVKAKKVW